MSDKQLIAIFVAGIAGLVGKVIWDWLKNNRGTSTHADDCRDCACLKRIEKCEKQNVTLESDVKYMGGELNSSKQAIKELMKSIQSIEVNIAQLVAIVKERSVIYKPVNGEKHETGR